MQGDVSREGEIAFYINEKKGKYIEKAEAGGDMEKVLVTGPVYTHTVEERELLKFAQEHLHIVKSLKLFKENYVFGKMEIFLRNGSFTHFDLCPRSREQW